MNTFLLSKWGKKRLSTFNATTNAFIPTSLCAPQYDRALRADVGGERSRGKMWMLEKEGHPKAFHILDALCQKLAEPRGSVPRELKSDLDQERINGGARIPQKRYFPMN